jgi:hypothetical protein
MFYAKPARKSQKRGQIKITSIPSGRKKRRMTDATAVEHPIEGEQVKYRDSKASL